MVGAGILGSVPTEWLALGFDVALQTPEELDAPPVDVDATTVFGAAVTIVVAYVLVRIATFALTSASERTVEYRITIKAVIPLVKFVIYAVALVVILGPVLDLTTTQILAFSGLLGAALGLGIKDLFANVVGGIAIVFERPYNTGDKVAIDGHYGEVTEVGLRSTKLVTNDDDEISVPNYRFITETVANANSGANELMAVPEVHIEHGQDLTQAKGIVRQAMVSSRYVYVSEDHPVRVRVDTTPAYVTLRGRAYVNDVRHEFAFESDVRERVLEAFEEHGIETPDVTTWPERE